MPCYLENNFSDGNNYGNKVFREDQYKAAVLM